MTQSVWRIFDQGSEFDDSKFTGGHEKPKNIQTNFCVKPIVSLRTSFFTGPLLNTHNAYSELRRTV